MDGPFGIMSESTLQRGAELQGLSTAILLPGAGLFGDRPGRGLADVGPLTHIGGLSLFQRTVLTLQRGGIRQLIVLAGPDEELLKQALARGARVTIPVRWMPVREFPLDDPRTWESLAAEVRGFCLVAGVQAVFSKGLIEHLRQTVRDGEALVVTREAGPVEPAAGRRNPVVAWQEGRLVSFHNQPGQQGHQVAADLVVLPASILNPPNRAAAASTSGVAEAPGMTPMRRWLERAAVEGRVRVVAAASHAGLWYRDVWDQASAGHAERTLFRSLKGEAEGFVDRYFNRTFSRLLTRLFLQLKCSPNTITMVATAVGLLAAIGFGLGNYTAGIVAALLFQLAAIIDCCDGEVARLTFTESPSARGWISPWTMWCISPSLPGLPAGPIFVKPGPPRHGSRWRSAGRPCSAMPWRSGWSRRPKNRCDAGMEHAETGGLVRLYPEECGESRLLGGGLPVCHLG